MEGICVTGGYMCDGEASFLYITYIESHGSHGNFYEGEQEQCCSVPVGVLYGGQRVMALHSNTRESGLAA